MKKNRGLCSTCSNAGSCGFMLRQTNPTIFCEEFCCDLETNDLNTILAEESSSQSVVDVDGEEPFEKYEDVVSLDY